MAKLNDTGVYQLTNKNWAFRYTITADGRKKDVLKAKDEFGNPLKTKTEAIRARNKAVEREREGKKPAPKVRKSFKEVYEEYCGNGRRDRAYRTKQKQDSLWNNHLCAKYGKRFVDEITAAEVNDTTYDLANYYPGQKLKVSTGIISAAFDSEPLQKIADNNRVVWLVGNDKLWDEVINEQTTTISDVE